MPIIDLATPWIQATESTGSLDGFHQRHQLLLERLRRQRAPSSARLADPAPGTQAFPEAGSAALHASLRTIRDAMHGDGWRVPREIILVVGSEPGRAYEVLPEPAQPAVALFVDRAQGDELSAALIAGIATWHRWSAAGPTNPIARIAATGRWDKWDAMRETPLAEWIYTDGLATHAVAERFPTWSVGQLLACSRTAHERLRQMERDLRVELESELDQSGIGLVIKWLAEEASPTLRRLRNGQAVPQGAGRYLAWRMLEERVRRVGVLAAAGMDA